MLLNIQNQSIYMDKGLEKVQEMKKEVVERNKFSIMDGNEAAAYIAYKTNEE